MNQLNACSFSKVSCTKCRKKGRMNYIHFKVNGYIFNCELLDEYVGPTLVYFYMLIFLNYHVVVILLVL